MCDDHLPSGPQTAGRPEPTRRSFLHGAATIGAATALLREFPRPPLRSAARAAAGDGLSAYSMAMHVHSSFSEQYASMDSQLFQAAQSSLDVLWWTDHDARMDSLDYRQAVHFTSLTNEQPAAGQGQPWHWQAQQSGSLSGSSGGGIVSNPVTPNDPDPHGSLQVTAKTTNSGLASFGYFADSQTAQWNYRDNLTGQTLAIDVLLTDGWSRGYLELAITTSYHQGAGGAAAGQYSLSYQFVPAGQRASRTAQGTHGVITIPVTPASGEKWYTATITPSDDIAALWPQIDYRDFALWELFLNAVSTGDEASGYFGYLRFDRANSGEVLLKQQSDMAAVLAPKYPSVTQFQGLEVSGYLPHMNWFGGTITQPDYSTTDREDYPSHLQHTIVPGIHAAGGLVSYNHPFGYGFDEPFLSASRQNTLLHQVATALLPTSSSGAAMGADLLEVGYVDRSGVDLTHHVALWDVLSRNGAFLTGNGTNDDHFGQNWPGLTNNWFTSVWAASMSEADLLSALAAGRAWCASLSGYRGSLDLLVDGSVPMGSVSVSSVTSRRLSATATALPSGGRLQVLQGDVDYAGTSDLTANTSVIATYSGSDLAGGSVTQTLDTGKSSFVRTQVIDQTGTVVALSNPVWLLRSAPPGGIPAARQS